MFSVQHYGHVGFSIGDTVTEKVDESKEKIEIEQNKDNMVKGLMVGGIIAGFFLVRWFMSAKTEMSHV